ncbi:MAG: polysaccharide deacetylase family protein, partial [Pseudomonadota bacterium]
MTDRDLIGYGRRPPHPQWPGDARVAVQFVLNVEEGSESSVLNGDDRSEAYLHELPGRPAREGERDFSIESMYDYGARAGVWRVLDVFDARDVPLTAFAVGRALELNPEVGRVLGEAGHEVAGHGYRWLDYHQIAEDTEREHIRRTIEVIEQICGKRPV